MTLTCKGKCKKGYFKCRGCKVWCVYDACLPIDYSLCVLCLSCHMCGRVCVCLCHCWTVYVSGSALQDGSTGWLFPQMTSLGPGRPWRRCTTSTAEKGWSALARGQSPLLVALQRCALAKHNLSSSSSHFEPFSPDSNEYAWFHIMKNTQYTQCIKLRWLRPWNVQWYK